MVGRKVVGGEKEKTSSMGRSSWWWLGWLGVGLVLAFAVVSLWEMPRHWEAVELARVSGFEAFEHTVITEDGFVLTMQQIPPRLDTPEERHHHQHQHGKEHLHGLGQQDPSSSSSKANHFKGVVFLQHGLLESSSVWLLHGRDSLALQLASLGYEVWLGNNRGNVYGKEHLEYSPSDVRFWDWTWYDMAIHDFPSQLKYVLNYTKAEQIFYVGQSQGASQAFAGLSLHPELVSHIKLLIAFAPGMFLRQSSNSAMEFMFENVNKGWFGSSEFVPYVHLRNFLPKYLLGFLGEYCMRSLEFISEPLNATAAPILYSLVPSGSTSTKNVKYWVQLVRSGEFQMPDFGPEENLRLYQSETPLRYPLEKVDCPTVLFLAGKDTAVDVKKTVDRLSHRHLHVEESFAHADYIWSSSAVQVYPKIIQQLLDHTT